MKLKDDDGSGSGKSARSYRSNMSKNSFRSYKSGKPESVKSKYHKHYYGPFVNLCEDVENNPDDWERYAYGFEPYENYYDCMPSGFGERLSNFEKLLLIKIFKPEKIAESLTMYLE